MEKKLTEVKKNRRIDKFQEFIILNMTKYESFERPNL